MAPPESAKVVLGVLSLVGIGVILYVVSKQLRKKKKGHDNGESHGKGVQPEKSQTQSSDDTVPKHVHWRKSEDEEEKEETLVSESVTQSQTSSTTEASSISMSMSGWEDVKPMDHSFVEVKSPTEEAGQNKDSTEDVTSQMGADPLGSFTEIKSPQESHDKTAHIGSGLVTSEIGQDVMTVVSQSKESSVPEAPATSTEEPVSKDTLSSAAETGQSQSLPEPDIETAPTLPGEQGQQEKGAADDVQSLQSEDTSSGEAPSFEQINGSDDGLYQAESHEGEVENPHQEDDSLTQPLAESLQSFEQVSMISPAAKADPGKDYLPSFEHISGDGAVSMKLEESSIVIIPESVSLTQSQNTEQDEENKKKGDDIEEQPKSEGQAEGEAYSEERIQLSESTQDTSQRDDSLSKEEQQTQASGGDKTDGGSLPSFEVIPEKGLGDVKEFYSSESLQSFATAVSGSDSSKQDFYSPVSSPPTVNSSFDDTSFKSFDDSTSYDTEASEEMTFYDLEASGKLSPPSPQDRTPTNTPVPEELGGGDTEYVKTPIEEAPSKMAESTSVDDMAGDKLTGGKETKSEVDKAADTKPPPSDPESITERPLLDLDKDKITEAILQAQNAPDKLEIGHLQVLVELLRRDDWTLLNTTMQCLIRATAFTINVEILRVCEGPKELSRLLVKFASLLVSGSKPAAGKGQSLVEGAPRAETLFLNSARVVNNLAMDIKSQAQLEGSIPALTDLLMTEGISETVTLASLQPLTNLSTCKTYHGQYTRLLQQLYSFLDTSHSAPLRLQCLKLLVNLSLNADMVPHMLAAKAPSCLLDLLDINYDVELLLRTVTFLANVMTIMQERNLSPSNLPPDEKAASPETLLSALVAHDRRDALRNKVYRLTRHDSQDVCYQASRLYKFVVSPK